MRITLSDLNKTTVYACLSDSDSEYLLTSIVGIDMNYDQKVAWMRAKIRRMIRKRLRESNLVCIRRLALKSITGNITKDSETQMHWDAKYWTLVVEKHRVLIENLPYHYVPLTDLNRASGSLARLEMRWLLWKIGATRFRQATSAELERLAEEGWFDHPSRLQPRSDKGAVRRHRQDPETRSKRLRQKVIKTPRVVPDGADD